MENIQRILKEFYEQKVERVKVVLKEPKAVTQFTRAVKKDKKYDENGRLIGWTKKREGKKEYILYLKMSSRGFVCLSNRLKAKYVYPYWTVFNENEIESIEPYIEKDKNIDWITYNRNYILSIIHPNMWDSLKKRLMLNEDEHFLNDHGSHKKITTVSMSSKFPEYVCAAIKDAIENKKSFSYTRKGTKRDLKVTIEPNEKDGFVYGWYSSEYSGYLNGAYYLLVNPTTAIMYEYD